MAVVDMSNIPPLNGNVTFHTNDNFSKGIKTTNKPIIFIVFIMSPFLAEILPVRLKTLNNQSIIRITVFIIHHHIVKIIILV